MRLCSICKVSKMREELLVKRVQFVGFGSGGQTVRSRVVAYVCVSCVKQDPDWNRESYDKPVGGVV